MIVARLIVGEKQRKSHRVLCLLHWYALGLREAEVAQELGWNRRTVNNYLRRLRECEQAYKLGRLWFASSYLKNPQESQRPLDIANGLSIITYR